MKDLTSCLYESVVLHQRTRPKPHRVKHSMFSFFLDLDEINEICKNVPLISANKLNVYGLYDSDHFEATTTPLKQKVQSFVREYRSDLAVEKVFALTSLRFLGYVFNPITVFYCFSKSSELLCAVAEVGNTFGEKKPYLIAADGAGQTILRDVQQKLFYVSPFIELDTDVQFTLSLPGDKLNLQINTLENNQVILGATMNGVRHELTTKSLLKMTFKYPFVTFGVIAAIHFHALQLWLKKIPFIRKEDNQQLQTGVLRPHKSSEEQHPYSQVGEERSHSQEQRPHSQVKEQRSHSQIGEQT